MNARKIAEISKKDGTKSNIKRRKILQKREDLAIEDEC